MLCQPYNVFAQKTSPTFTEMPEGISVDYFCFSRENRSKMLVIGTDRKIVFNCYKAIRPKEKDVSDKSAVLNEIVNIMSFAFLDSVQQCLLSRPQRDTDCGYWLTKKEGDKTINFCIAAKDVNGKICASKKLTRLLKLTDELFRGN